MKKLVLTGCAFVCGTVVILIIAGLLVLHSATTDKLAELDIPPDMRVQFYCSANWDLNFDLYYDVYRNGSRVYRSQSFFYVFGETEGVEFGYEKILDRYIAVYDKREPNRIVILMDLAEEQYGKNNLIGSMQYHNEFNARAREILELFRSELQKPDLKLDEFHYNRMR